MIPERRQFQILRRLFLSRMIDLDILAGRGEPQKLLVQIASMLAALSLVLALYAVPKYAITKLKPHALLVAAWGDQEFFIATTMAVVGLFTVLCWDTIFPQKRDVLVLFPLPVRQRVMAAAKMAAVGSALGVSIVATNVFLGCSYPLLVVPPDAGPLGFVRSLAALWITMICAGAFMFCTLLAIQGVASQLLSYRLYARASSYLQFAAFFAILAIYFLTPPLGTLQGLTAPGNQTLLQWLPSFWFLGLFQQLNGPVEPIFAGLARQALAKLGIAAVVAFGTYAWALQRNARKIVEQPDIAPSDRSRQAAAVFSRMLQRLIPTPYQRAIVLFTARTIARSRQHRLLLAAYLGVAFAISLAYSKDLLYHRAADAWRHPNVPLLVVGAVSLFLPIAGVRALFAMPIALKSNWIFQITAVQSPADYFRAVRKVSSSWSRCRFGSRHRLCTSPSGHSVMQRCIWRS